MSHTIEVIYFKIMIMKDGSGGSFTAPVHSGKAPIAGWDLIKTVLVSLFLCTEKLEQFVGFNFSRKLTT